MNILSSRTSILLLLTLFFMTVTSCSRLSSPYSITDTPFHIYIDVSDIRYQEIDDIISITADTVIPSLIKAKHS